MDQNPITSRRIYETKVFFQLLYYGSELWRGVTTTQLLPLERAKWIQGVPYGTRTDIALSCLGIYLISYLIDIRKLIFLSQLCHTDSNMRFKHFFVNRLTSYYARPAKSKGFSPT
jgi:hypothetical protein